MTSFLGQIKVLRFTSTWNNKVFFSLVDQGFYSGANFLMSLLLARWLNPGDYGGYSVAYSIFLLLSSFQNSFVLEPISIFGPKRLIEDNQYIAFFLWAQLLLGILVAMVSGLLLTSYRSNYLDQFLGVILIAYMGIQTHWYLRRIVYLYGRPWISATASIAYTIVLFGGILFYRDYANISPFLLMLIASIIASIIITLLLRLNITFSLNSQSLKLMAREWSREAWNYGKFILLASGLSWLSTSAYSVFTERLINAEQAGVYKALQNFILPFQQIYTAIYLFLLPWLSGIRLSGTVTEFRKQLRKLFIIWSLVAIVYCLPLIIFNTQIMSLLYKSDFYVQNSGLLIYIAIYLFLSVVPQVYGVGIRTLNYSKGILFTKIGAAVFAIVSCFGLFQFGVAGIIFSMLISMGAEAIITIFVFRKLI